MAVPAFSKFGSKCRVRELGTRLMHAMAGHAAPGKFFFGPTFDLDFLQTLGSKVKLSVFNPFLTAFNRMGAEEVMYPAAPIKESITIGQHHQNRVI